MARTELTHEELMALQKEYQDSEAEEEAMFHNGAYDDDEPSPDASPRMGNNRRRSESPQYLGRRASGRRGSSPRSSGRYIWQQTEKKETFENEERRVRALEVLESREELAWYASALGEVCLYFSMRSLLPFPSAWPQLSSLPHIQILLHTAVECVKSTSIDRKTLASYT